MSMVRIIACSLCIAVLLASTASAADRVSASEKGSLLIYPKVELRWDIDGNLIQDTIIELTNDYPAGVDVQMYFVHGDGYLEADPVNDERAHPGWHWVDNKVYLTRNDPVYWAASTGNPFGTSPFTILDPGDPDNGIPEGRPAMDGTADRVLRGYIIAWAVDYEGKKIRWNHLSGKATLIHYMDGSAWSYSPYSFQTDAVDHGDLIGGDPGVMHLDGSEYDACFDVLLLDFFAPGSLAMSGGGRNVFADTDLTVFPVTADLRQETDGPVTTKIKFAICNENEVCLSNTERCVTGWDQQLLSMYDAPNHFLLANLQTDKGKARLDGIASPVECGEHSQDAAILGVAMTMLDFDGGADVARAGTNLVGMGTQCAMILTDEPEEPPLEKNLTTQILGNRNATGIRTLGRTPVLQLEDMEIPAE